MGDYSSFYLYRKYEVIGDELVDLGITSIDADGTQEPVMKEECDPACGCPPPEPIYRWVQTEDTVCLEVITRQTSGTPYCIGYNKIVDVTNEESFDSGETWQFVSSSSTLVEVNSPDCGYPIYRWTQSGTTCIGYDKYRNNIKEQSTNAGASWTVVNPPEYSASTLIEVNSRDCGYLPPFEGRYKLILNDSSVVTGDCNSSSAVTVGEVTDPYSRTVASAELGTCCKTIGTYAFSDCGVLTSVTMADNVTTISDYAFLECYNLVNVKMSSGITSIGVEAFRNCDYLTNITIPGSVTTFGNRIFKECDRLTGATFASGVTTISNEIFYNCRAFSSVVIPDTVTSIGYNAFYWCRLPNVAIPDSVTTIGDYAFEDCRYLTGVTIGSGCTSIGDGVFHRCSGLTSVLSLATTPPTLGSNVFQNTNSSFTIYVPCESVDTYKVASGWSTYASQIRGIPPCGSPKYILTLNDSSIVSAECDSTSAITYNEISAYTDSIVSIEIGDCVTHIYSGTFQNCTGITYIQIPIGVIYIGDGAFSGCTNLTHFECDSDIPPTLGNDVFDDTNVSIYVSCEDLDLYKAIWGEYADEITCTFDGKYKFTMTNGSVLSAECDSTSAITHNDVPQSAIISGVSIAEIGNCITTIGDSAFTDCWTITRVIIPDNVTTIGNWAFSSCYNIPSITIPDSVTNIGTGAFYDLRDGDSLSEIRISNNITSISPFLFTGGTLLKRLNSDVDGVFNIPSGVTSIGEYAFQMCTSLTNLVIPSNVTSIGSGAFMNCDALTTVTCEAITPPTLSTVEGEGVFQYSYNINAIYVPAASVNAYKAAAGWSDFASIIQAIP